MLGQVLRVTAFTLACTLGKLDVYIQETKQILHGSFTIAVSTMSQLGLCLESAFWPSNRFSSRSASNPHCSGCRLQEPWKTFW